MSEDKQAQKVSSNALNREITEHKKTELSIAASQETFEAYITYSPVAVIVFESEGKFVYLNEEACKQLGYSIEELSQLSFT